MGYVRHHAIIVTSWDEKLLAKALIAAKNTGNIVTPMTPGNSNGYATFVVVPDGSKEGWTHSQKGDEAREKFLIWLNKQEFKDHFEWVVVAYGADDSKAEIETSAWHDPTPYTMLEEPETDMSYFKLCYVEGNTAYFTTQDLNKQMGDDWDDAPYQHNAGTPYEASKSYSYLREGEWEGEWVKGSDYNDDGTPEWEIKKVMFDCQYLSDPAARMLTTTVHEINSGACPWLYGKTPTGYISIPAGTSIDTFKELVKRAGGKIYVEEV